MKEKENTDAEEGRERMEWSVSLSHVVNLLGCTKEKLEAVKNNYAPPTSLKMLKNAQDLYIKMFIMELPGLFLILI